MLIYKTILELYANFILVFLNSALFEKSGTFTLITQGILTTTIFHRLELMTIILSFLWISGAQLRGRRGGWASPAVFWKSKKVPWFLGKKGPNCVFPSPWVESSIKDVVLRVSLRKSSKIFPSGTFFSCVFDEEFIEVP